MALKDYTIEPLFAEPYFRVNLGHAISSEQEEFIRNLKMVKNQSNLISEDLYIFNLPELASVSEAIQEALDIYAEEVMGIAQKLYVTQSWSLANNPGIGMHGHSHSNSLISGSFYYTDMQTPVARMIFEKHRSYQQLELSPRGEKRNIFNTSANIVEPKKHDLILFSSGLQHLVETNNTTEPRYSIAFNTFIKGKLGNYRDVSELTL